MPTKFHETIIKPKYEIKQMLPVELSETPKSLTNHDKANKIQTPDNHHICFVQRASNALQKLQTSFH